VIVISVVEAADETIFVLDGWMDGWIERTWFYWLFVSSFMDTMPTTEKGFRSP
jgi:hypothetical protein